jgi:hypothetical protein
MRLKRAHLFVSFCIGIATGLLIFSPTHNFLQNWQELIGSLAGAFFGIAGTVGVYLFRQARERVNILVEEKEKWAKNLQLIEKHLTWAINSLADIDAMLHNFYEIKLRVYKERVEVDDQAGRYSVGQAFIPLTPTFILDEELLKTTTGSMYVENCLMLAISTSKNMPTLMTDLDRQFDRTLVTNFQVGLAKVNSAVAHNIILKENLREFEESLLSQAFEHNFPVYLRILVKALVAVKAIQEMGMEKWQATYNFPDLTTTDSRMKRMEKIFTEPTNKMIESLRGAFKSDLVLIGEQSPYQIATGIPQHD